MGCIHHWLIDTPGHGPTLNAVCKSCGAKTTFPSRRPALPATGRDGLVQLFMDAHPGLPRRSRQSYQ